MLPAREGKSRRRALAARAWHALAPSLGLRAQFCEGERCRRFTVAHRRLRRDGIILTRASDGADLWLCSPECFESALVAQIETLIPARTVAQIVAQIDAPGRGERGLTRMPFHLALLQKGILRQADLERAQQHAACAGARLADALLSLALVSEEQLAQAYARESGCAFYKQAAVPVAPAAVLPRALSLHFGAVAVHAHAERVVIGFTTRIDRAVLVMAAQMSGCRVEACFITQSRYREQLAADRRTETGDAPAVSASGAAQAIAREAVRLGAERVRLAGSADRLWVRHCNDDGGIYAGLHDAVFAIGEEARTDAAGIFARSVVV